MSPIDHILLYVLLFSVFYFFAKNSKHCKTEKDFWKLALIPILCFVIIEGCRYGRGQDYPAYKYRFEHITPTEEPQKLFLLLMQTLDAIGFNYIGAFMTYALIFITGTIFFIRKTFNRDEAQWMYLFILCSMLIYSESMIRQYIAMPFMFISLGCIYKKNWLMMIISLIIVCGIHSGAMVSIPFFLFFYFLYKKVLPIKIVITLLFFAYYIISAGAFSSIGIQILGALNITQFLGNDNLTHYIEDSDRWLGADSYIDATEQTFITKALQFIFDSSILIATYKVLQIKQERLITTFYNIISVGFILNRLFFGYEIFARMTGQLYIFWFIPLSYSIYIYGKLKFQCDKNKLKPYIILALLYQIMFYARFIFLNPKVKFIWS